VVSLGMGDNSVGMLMGLYETGIRPDAILFSNLGNEYAHTIAFIPALARWLKKVGFPSLTVVEYRPARFKRQAYSTIAGNCIANRTLPGLAYGRKSCSMKWKGQPMDRAVTEMFGAQGCFRLIGYDCDPRDMKRFAKATNKDGVNEKRPLDQFIYPLVDWGWGRQTCIRAIQRHGLPNPVKSSCFFCPSCKSHELSALSEAELLAIVIIEANAYPSTVGRTTQGLWRGKKMTDHIIKHGLLPAQLVEKTWLKWSAETRDVEMLATAEATLFKASGYESPFIQMPTGDDYELIFHKWKPARKRKK